MTVNICGLPHEVVEVEDAFNMDCHMDMIEYKDLVMQYTRASILNNNGRGNL